MRNKCKTIFALLLAVGVLLSFPSGVMGATVTEPLAVQTQSNYTPIYDMHGLDNIRNNLSGKYILMNDIDLSGWGSWEPIGDGDYNNDTGTFNYFSGGLDGNGYTILSLTADTDRMVYAGLFSRLVGTTESFGVLKEPAVVKNLIMEQCYIQGSYAGGIAGTAAYALIENCHFINGTIKTSSSAATSTGYAGGIVGIATNSTINRCSNSGTITASGFAGGITSQASGTDIQNCYNLGAVTSLSTADNFFVDFNGAGGIVANIIDGWESDRINACYNMGQISSHNDIGNVGGIAGKIQSVAVANCYSLDSSASLPIGQNSSDVTARNVRTLNNTQMQQQDNYVGFDFIYIWTMPASGTPELKWFVEPGYIPVLGMALLKQELTLPRDSVETLYPIFLPTHPTNKQIFWRSDNERIATVTDGVVNAVGVGMTTVHAKTVDGGFEASCEITVTPAEHFIRYHSQDSNAEEIVFVSSIKDVLPSNATQHNLDLALVCAGLAAAAYNTHRSGREPYDYIKNAFINLGFDEDSFSPENYYHNAKHPDYKENSSAFSFAKMELNNEKTLIAVVIRGSHGKIEDITSDWKSNANIQLQSKGRHYGFNTAMEEIYRALQSYLGVIPTDGNTAFLITGHSRGGAVANLLAANLIDNKVQKENVYAYTFATPDSVCVERGLFNPNGEYDSIFNLCNDEDIVTHLPPYPQQYVPQLPSYLPPRIGGKLGHTERFTPLIEKSGVKYNHDAKTYIDFIVSQIARPTQSTPSKSQKFNGSLYSIECPVDIELIDQSGKVIVSIVNDELTINNLPLDDGFAMFDGDKKYIWLYDNGSKYTLRMQSTNTGIMNYTIVESNSLTKEIGKEKSFNNVVLTNGKMMISEVGGNISVSDTKLFVVDSNGTKQKEILTDGTEIALSTTTLILILN